jgi:type I restriction enzyme S subunit
MNLWRGHKIADLIAEGTLLIGDGYRAKNEELSSTGLPFARAGNINDGFHFSDADHFPEVNLANVGNKVSAPGDVVFTSKGTVGRFAFVQDKTPRFVYSPQLCFWRSLSAKRIDPRFLYYWMFGREFFLQYKGVAGQTDMAEYVSLTDQRRMHITLPPLSEQRAIASILGSVDDKIELNRRMNETLEALAQTLFKSWFIDPTRNGLPEGWRYATIAELCEINSWTLGKGDQLDQMEYVEISEVMRGNIAKTHYYERGEEPSRARRRLRHGDTVLSTVRLDRGAYFLCLNPSPNLIGSTGFAVLTPTKAPWSFVHAAVTQADVFGHLGQHADGGAYPAVRPEIIGSLEVALPNKREQVEEFHRVCAPLYERAELNRHESRTLAKLRDALLPKLLSGGLRVPELKN